MRPIALAAAVSVALLAVFALEVRGAPPADPADLLIESAKKLDRDFLDAFNAGDVEKLMACYWNSDQLTVYPPEVMEASGVEDVKATFTKMAAGMKGAKLMTAGARYRVAGEAVIGWGRWTVTMPGPDGRPLMMDGRYSQVVEKKDGKWVYTHDHASAPMRVSIPEK